MLLIPREGHRTSRDCISSTASHLDWAMATRMLFSSALAVTLAACAQLSITPEAVKPSDPAVAAHAIEAEPIPPKEVVVSDFEVSPSSVRENGSPFHRLINLFRQSSPEERQLKIGRAVAVSLSEQALKRLNKAGLKTSRISSDTNASVPYDTLLVTGRLVNANEGNRLTRIALGCGAGESRLDTEVRVFRVVDGERAEVLAFSTHADSGKMPGLIPSLGAGEFFIGPMTLLSKVKDTASTGQKIYSTQIDHLGARTGDEVARYLTQYAAREGWIPGDHAQSVKLAAN
jgi:Domain of unknown function (DUF4410)